MKPHEEWRERNHRYLKVAPREMREICDENFIETSYTVKNPLDDSSLLHELENVFVLHVWGEECGMKERISTNTSLRDLKNNTTNFLIFLILA